MHLKSFDTQSYRGTGTTFVIVASFSALTGAPISHSKRGHPSSSRSGFNSTLFD